jgi:hypothetical protein
MQVAEKSWRQGGFASLWTRGWLLDRIGSLKDVLSDPCPRVDIGHEDSIERAVLLFRAEMQGSGELTANIANIRLAGHSPRWLSLLPDST